MLLAFVVITLALSIATMAEGSATASSSGARASASSDIKADLLARAEISSLLYIENDTDEGNKTYASASVSASDLPRVDIYPATSSLATAWVGDDNVAFDSWG